MIIAHSISEVNHPNCVSLEKLKNYNGPISFDGVYKSVWENRNNLAGKDVILFISGDYVGGNNSFDPGRHFDEDFCNWSELTDLFDMGFKVGWHTWSHKDLTTLSDEELEYEIKPMFECDDFAYPYGKFDKRVEDVVKKYFKRAYSVEVGDNSDYQLTREFL